MSEPTSAPVKPPAPGPGGKAPGKKYAGLTKTQWYIVGGVFVAALGYIWWRNRQNAAAAAGQSPTSQGSNECTDQNGNPVDCGELEAEELAALQNSLDQLGAGGGGSGGGSGGGTGPGPGGTTVPPNSTPPGPTPAPNPGGGTGAWAYPAPGNLQASSVSSHGYRLSWSAVTGPSGQKPSSYTVATFQQNGQQVDQFTTGSTSTSEYGKGGTGLHPGWQYHSNVWANGGPQAPQHASVTVTLKGSGGH